MTNENNNYDPLEHLFRKIADQFNDLSYREEDWLKLEKKLDERDLRIGYRRKLILLAAASVLIIGLLGYFTFQNYNEIDRITEQIDLLENPQNSQSGDQFDSTPPSGSEGEIPNGHSPIDTETDNPLNEITELNDDQETSSEINENTDSRNNNSSVHANQTGSEYIARLERKTLEEENLKPEIKAALPHMLAKNIPIKAEADRRNTDVQSPGNEIVNSRAGAIPITAKVSPADKTPEASSFTLGLMLSPDMSTAGSFSNFYEPGIKGGISVEYALNKRFSFISGFSFSNVRYRAGSNEYNPPDYWNSGISPDETTAVCLILDIPITFKSTLQNFENSRIYGTAGISSYIMMNENYQFQYNNTYPNQPGEWKGSTGTAHWASNTTLSIGYEIDISSNWALRAEPHIKIPLTGVGWGRVKLYSVGSAISLNYNI